MILQKLKLPKSNCLCDFDTAVDQISFSYGTGMVEHVKLLNYRHRNLSSILKYSNRNCKLFFFILINLSSILLIFRSW